MTVFEICQQLQALPLSAQIRESDWIFPWLSIAHFSGLALAGGTIAFVDLRLLGLGLKRTPVSQVTSSLLSCMWAGWALMFFSGSLIFISEAEMLYGSWFFRAKFIMMALAGLNALIFHYTVFRRVGEWDMAPVAPLQARLTGAVSLSLWLGMIFAGRAIPYFSSTSL